MTPRELILRARTVLLFQQPFFGYLSTKLRIVETKSMPSMATDGQHLFYNPDFVMQLTKNQVVTGVVHEILHNVTRVFDRQGARKRGRWYRANDYAINQIAKENGFEPVIVPGVFKWLQDDKYKGMSTEQIYETLDDEEGGCGCGGILPPKSSSGGGDTDSEINTEPVDWKKATAEARDYAKARGSLPAGIEDVVEKILHPPVPWRRIIKGEFVKAVRCDWSFHRPNRRYAHLGMVMPVRHGYRTTAEVWLDSSGSIDKDQWASFLGATLDIAKELSISVDVGVCDAEVQSFTKGVKSPDDVKKVKFLGRGGTSFAPAFDHAKKRRPASMVYFTDLGGSFPQWKPRWSTLWVIPNDYKKYADQLSVPFGRKLVLPEGFEK